jgi:predicted metalloendopeptidase
MIIKTTASHFESVSKMEVVHGAATLTTALSNENFNFYVQHLEELKTKDRFGEEEETVNKTLIGKVYVENTSPEAKEKSKPWLKPNQSK